MRTASALFLYVIALGLGACSSDPHRPPELEDLSTKIGNGSDAGKAQQTGDDAAAAPGEVSADDAGGTGEENGGGPPTATSVLGSCNPGLTDTCCYEVDATADATQSTPPCAWRRLRDGLRIAIPMRRFDPATGKNTGEVRTFELTVAAPRPFTTRADCLAHPIGFSVLVSEAGASAALTRYIYSIAPSGKWSYVDINNDAVPVVGGGGKGPVAGSDMCDSLFNSDGSGLVYVLQTLYVTTPGGRYTAQFYESSLQPSDGAPIYFGIRR